MFLKTAIFQRPQLREAPTATDQRQVDQHEEVHTETGTTLYHKGHPSRDRYNIIPQETP